MTRCFLLLVTLISNSVCAAVEFEWRVKTPFALFSYLTLPPETIDDLYRKSDEGFEGWAARLGASFRAESPWRRFDDQNAPWDPDKGSYHDDYARPQNTQIRVRLRGVQGDCAWQVDGVGDTVFAGQCSDWVGLAQVPLPTESNPSAKISVTIVGTNKSYDFDVKIEHLTVVAMGDSYASGEGNPDSPTVWRKNSVRAESYKWIEQGYEKPAAWWDDSCHRSFWNNQTLAAIDLASQNSHRLLTFLQYSCSGAEILDGLIVPQKVGETQSLPKSQLRAATEDLCDKDANDNAALDVEDSYIDTMSRMVSRLSYRTEVLSDNGFDLAKCKGKIRSPDFVLLSIGGNDAGFAGLIAWAVVPAEWKLNTAKLLARKGVVCPDRGRETLSWCGNPLDFHLRWELDVRFAVLADAFDTTLGIERSKVVHTLYPNPLLTSQQKYCGEPAGKPSTHGPWAAAAVLKKTLITRRPREYQFNFTPGEAKILSETSIEPMHEKLLEISDSLGFTIVDTYDSLIDRNWCDPREGDPPTSLPSHSFDASLPFWQCECNASDNANDCGGVISATCWNPYAPTKRAIRTINDSVLTQMESSLNNGFRGAAHPNLVGHARIAERVARTLTNLD